MRDGTVQMCFDRVEGQDIELRGAQRPRGARFTYLGYYPSTLNGQEKLKNSGIVVLHM